MVPHLEAPSNKKHDEISQDFTIDPAVFDNLIKELKGIQARLRTILDKSSEEA